MFIGIDHFAIASPNTKRLAEWYIATLDFKTAFEYAGAYILEANNGSLLEIIPSEGTRPATQIKTPGMRHTAIGVENFDAAYRQLQQRSVTFLGEPYEAHGNRLVFFTDPDGNVLHLIQRSKPLR